MEAKKCDRCHKFYDVEDGRCIDKYGNQYEIFFRKKQERRIEIDLCPECFDKFLSWLDSDEELENIMLDRSIGENKDRTDVGVFELKDEEQICLKGDEDSIPSLKEIVEKLLPGVSVCKRGRVYNNLLRFFDINTVDRYNYQIIEELYDKAKDVDTSVPGAFTTYRNIGMETSTLMCIFLYRFYKLFKEEN